MLLHRTHRKLVGKDKENKSLTRRIYSDNDYNEYVTLGKFAFSDPRALVPIDYFIEHCTSEHHIRDEWHYMPGTWEPEY